MAYPAIIPTARSYDPGNWPIKTYNSQSGAEVRILYGDKKFNSTLSLTYSNISDAEANQFLSHYSGSLGTYHTFTLAGSSATAVLTGWKGGSSELIDSSSSKWRYKEAPRLEAVRPGVSSVTVSLLRVI